MTIHDGSMECPNMEQYSEIPIFNTKAVVQQTGIPAPTLRAWERRYALLSPERSDNAYRLYSERDIVLIHWLKERIDEGMAISKAIALFRYLSEDRKQQKEHRSALQFSDAANRDEPSVGFDIVLPGNDERSLHEEEHIYQASETTGPADFWHKEAAVDSPGQNYSTAQNMRIVQNHLIEIFLNLDEQTAHVMMGSMFSLYSAEQVCLEIIVPTLWKIGELWAEGKITVSVEHFASCFFRALLTNRFYVTPGPLQGPLVLVAGSPREAHELAPLMLALFLRRYGLRVAYLGQSIETAGLLHTIKTLRPKLVCLSTTLTSNLPDVIQLDRLVQNLPTFQPTLVFGGQAFAHNAEIQAEIGGLYMNGDLKATAKKLRSIILEQTENNE